MFQLVYVSSATEEFSRQDLVDLLTQAKEKNTRLGITGMLLYKDGNFMQVLEGEEAAVRSLYETISDDPRHKDSIILLEEQVPDRVFKAWSMGFRNLTDPELKDLPGFDPFMNVSLTAKSFEDDPTGCWDLLNLFRETL